MYRYLNTTILPECDRVHRASAEARLHSKRVRETRHSLTLTIAQANIGVRKYIRTTTNTSTMALLVDKHRPRSLDALSYHPELSDRLKALVGSPEANRSLKVAVLIHLDFRQRAATSHIYSSMDLLARARRRGFRQR
jgi:hypothetical protein